MNFVKFTLKAGYIETVGTAIDSEIKGYRLGSKRVGWALSTRKCRRPSRRLLASNAAVSSEQGVRSLSVTLIDEVNEASMSTATSKMTC